VTPAHARFLCAVTPARARFLCACALALSVAVTVSGCASRRAAPDVSRAAVVNPPRSERGNPPFYEVRGKRYFVLDTSDGYVEQGIASWYGPDFHKRATSSGEQYDMYAMTAAHKTLPLPTWVEVTNLANGRRVIVKVNDRGPFVGTRIIDLSYAAAKSLDMIRAGTARVEVRALGAPEAPELPRAVQASVSAETPASPAAAGAQPATPKRPRSSFSLISEAAADELTAAERARAAVEPGPRLFVQVGAFSNRDNATRLVGRLKARGYANAFVVSDRDGLNRVRVGPLTDAREYDRVNDGLRRLGLAETRLVSE
jgi:rare lipoprotein A